ncbi:MAG TPA: radical SAM protein [Terriglobales bacterium]|nr:radical SAM protein [Terriglobales bacterium]
MACHDSKAMNRAEFQPAYLKLWQSGELLRRVELGLAKLADCTLCPRKCHVNRIQNKTKTCRTGRHAVVSGSFAHHGEERCLRGTRGSGTIFFSWCNLRCVFCQNYQISWQGEGRTVKAEELAGMMLTLQAQGCHNINLVTPEHVVPQILEALLLAVERGLNLPLVYNTSAYDSLDSLALTDGVIDIYMPDFKFWDPQKSRLYAKSADYPEAARRAIREMHRQVGLLVTDEQGIALRGVLLRHLVMPRGAAGTAEIMQWIARELSTGTYVNLMAQYRPAGRVSANQYPELDRGITNQELQQAYQAALAAGLYRLDGDSAAILTELAFG